MADDSLKVDDRVKRSGMPGCFGTVKELREEVTSTGSDGKDKSLLVKVQWDNGTVSLFAPDALEVING